LLLDDLLAQVDALVADVHALAGDQLADLLLALAAEAAAIGNLGSLASRCAHRGTARLRIGCSSAAGAESTPSDSVRSVDLHIRLTSDPEPSALRGRRPPAVFVGSRRSATLAAEQAARFGFRDERLVGHRVDLVDDSVGLGFLGRHKVVALGVLDHLLDGL